MPNRRHRATLAATILFAAASLAILAAPASAASCYERIQSLECWGGSSKCNIKFRNHTGLASGSGGSEYNQVSRAKTIRVWAVDENGDQVGSNKIKMLAGQNNTLNLDKKDGFEEINIRAYGEPDANSDLSIRMDCDAIVSTLEGTANCKVFIARGQVVSAVGSGYSTGTGYGIGYSCNNNRVRENEVL